MVTFLTSKIKYYATFNLTLGKNGCSLTNRMDGNEFLLPCPLFSKQVTLYTRRENVKEVQFG